MQIVTGVGGYVGHKVAVKYFTDHYPADKRAEAKVLDVGAGTGMVARGVCILSPKNNADATHRLEYCGVQQKLLV